MHYFITGHTGFKGAWLTLMLTTQGHQVSGLALDPENGTLFERAQVGDLVLNDFRLDIRDAESVKAALIEASPDVVIHMAAQPLVRESYLHPRATVETNVLGTLNVLEAVRLTPTVQAELVVTTDKVYRNTSGPRSHMEGDALGGHDPYSASKAMADLLTQSWAASFGGCTTVVARAGNVIGGGDVSADRLLPDLLSAFAQQRPARVRFPDAIRPWQHVLDCLHGYCMLVDHALAEGAQGAWNFGPPDGHSVTVAGIAGLAAAAWGNGASWVSVAGDHPHESASLTLDASRATSDLGWTSKLSAREAVDWTVTWHKAAMSGEDVRVITVQQIEKFRSMHSG